RATARKAARVNASTPFAEDILGGAGATIMGRNMFGGGPGPWDESWKGWWGDNPPFHHPVFVLTSHPREPLSRSGPGCPGQSRRSRERPAWRRLPPAARAAEPDRRLR